jgi:hypothetical protein
MEKEGRVLARLTGHVRVHLAAVEEEPKKTKKKFNYGKKVVITFIFFGRVRVFLSLISAMEKNTTSVS